jgi:Fic family protein
MELKQILERLTELKAEIGELGKLPKEVLQKINYKFRLDWNYYSNRMEGGTLTREETRSVMVGNITVAGKPIKDVMEMNGHDAVVREILRMGKGEVRISEKRIKEIHKAILKETDDPIKNRQIGTWKTEPNEIINYKDEKISFTAPADVADEMHELLNKTNAQLDVYFAGKKEAQHPLIIAADFHLGFVTIHPFFDGNGRTARILMNLILIACGYPPIIITDSGKQAYYQYLADIQAYGGDKELMYFQMAGLEMRSMLMVLKAAKGEDIEEEDDIDKRIALADKKIEVNGKNNDLPEKSAPQIQKIVNNNFLQIAYELERKLIIGKPGDWFSNVYTAVRVNGGAPGKFTSLPDGPNQIYLNKSLGTMREMEIKIHFEEFKHAKPKIINKEIEFAIHFEKYQYQITYGKKRITKRFPYSWLSDPVELKDWCRTIINEFMDDIDNELKKIDNGK